MMLKKVLIANRGEIACRIMRTAQMMGIETVAVYSDADAQAVHVTLADHAVNIGPGPAADSYLRIDKVIAAALEAGADCIHPGYGFLAENPSFAEACHEAGLVFIGPSGDAMRALGGKAQAKELAIAAGVPVVPGYQGDDQGADLLQDRANAIGYPVMIKAVSGGGGRGMRLVTEASQFQTALESAQREAAAAFGDPRVLIEKFVDRPRHIEVQVFGDSHGNVVHLFERDCTLQRRNQKVVEEAPAPGMSDELRQDMTSAAVQLARSVGYEGAGTVEFLVEGGDLGANAPWYFIEMNTRLQVEHPVTEAITGLDLVEWQFLVAGDEALPLEQDDIAFGGHAIEVRLCAEDPAADFAPSTGKIVEFDYLDDEGLRVESGVEPGSVISPYYDSMIAKVIRVDVDRGATLDALQLDLEDIDVLGVKTNLAFLHALLNDDDVVNGDLWTGLIAERLPQLVSSQVSPTAIAAGVRALLENERLAHVPDTVAEPWSQDDGFQLGGLRQISRVVLANGQSHDVTMTWQQGLISFRVDGEQAGTAHSEVDSDEFVTPEHELGPLVEVED
ncbi:MAG: acetyl-CoA carboxylase biotin carboxylase subunit, partial [Hyphomicrobiaceae bacterium]